MGANDSMAVRAYPEKMKIDILAFEARYKDGYRYLDRCGETLVQIQRHDRSWVVLGVNPQSGQLRNEDLNMLLTITHAGVILQLLKSPIEMTGAEKVVQTFAHEAEAVYEITTGALNVTDTTRVGARFRFLAEADSLEEADRFLRRGMASTLLDKVEEATQSKLRDGSVVYFVEDLESGRRKRLEISSQVHQKPGESPYTGIDPESHTGFVAVDIDTFTRPETGHYQRSNMFIQESYLSARTSGLEIFEWFRRLPAVKPR